MLKFKNDLPSRICVLAKEMEIWKFIFENGQLSTASQLSLF